MRLYVSVVGMQGDEHRDMETQSFWCLIAPIFTLTMVIFDRTVKGNRVAYYIL